MRERPLREVPSIGWTEAARRLLAVLGCGLALGLAAAWLASFVAPVAVESAGRELLRMEVQRRVGARIEALGNGALGVEAGRIVRANEARLATLRRQLAEGLPERVAAVVAEMRNADCECRKAVAHQVREGLEGAIGDLGRLHERLTELVRGQYRHTAAALLREFRIFTGVNALAFGLLGLAAVWRPRARVQLLLPALLLGASAVGVAVAYLFAQDWLHTLVFGHYVGWAYLAYLGAAFAGLLDVVFNRARITTQVLDALARAIGASFQALPC